MLQEEVSPIVPMIGEIRKGIELGKNYNKPFIWYQCPNCLKCRWVQIESTKESNFTGLCNRCYRASLVGFRRKRAKCRWISKQGYVFIRVYPEDFFHIMAGSTGYVMEHRLVMAKHLGRNLHRWEIVHHKNHVRDDNRIENLQLVSDDKHRQITILEVRIKYLENLLKDAGIKFNSRYEAG